MALKVGIRVERIRPKMVRDARLLDTFTNIDVYASRILERLPLLSVASSVRGAAASVHRALFLSGRPDRHGVYAFLGEDRIAAIAKATLHPPRSRDRHR